MPALQQTKIRASGELTARLNVTAKLRTRTTVTSHPTQQQAAAQSGVCLSELGVERVVLVVCAPVGTTQENRKSFHRFRAC